MGDNTADLDYKLARTLNLTTFAYIDNGSHHAAAVDDACAAWLRARPHYLVYGPGDQCPLGPAPVDDRAERRLVYQYVVAHARYHRTTDPGDYDAARDALIDWDDTHPDPAGDEMTG